VDKTDNELITLEVIHQFVEVRPHVLCPLSAPIALGDACATPAAVQVLDRYFGNVCELDLIFNFHKAYYILDELLIAGEQQETSKKTVNMLNIRYTRTTRMQALVLRQRDHMCVRSLLPLLPQRVSLAESKGCMHSTKVRLRPRARMRTLFSTHQVLKLITEQDAVCEEGTDKDMQ
jgi:hypothetical protein